MRHYRIRPNTVTAVQWTGDNLADLEAFAPEAVVTQLPPTNDLLLSYHDQHQLLELHDWLIRRPGRDPEALSDVAFHAIYEPDPDHAP